jgi:hypothetical protein
MIRQRPAVKLQGRPTKVRLKGVRQNVVKLKGQKSRVVIKGNWRDYPPPKE